MKYLSLVLVLIAVVVFAQLSNVIDSSQAESKSSAQEDYVAGELLVKFKTDAARQQLFSVHSRIGANVAKEFSDLGWQQVVLPADISVAEAIQLYRSESSVAEAQPNFIYRVGAMPNDPSMGNLYGMTKISAPTAWDTTTGSNSVVVAIIDTGINYNHEDLAANVWINPGETAGNGVDDDGNGYADDMNGYDFVFLDGDPADDHSHGSHCAGTIGAVGNNGRGVAGVNWNVRLMALKTHDGAVGASTSVRVISAFNYVRDMKMNRGVNVRVTSNSYGGPPEATSYDQALKDAIDAAGNADILNVFAAGNDNFNNDLTPTYPGSYNSPSILTVAASDQNDAKASFSSYGATSVDVAAPGVAIYSTVLNQGYGNKSGTSMATPHTAGAAALILAQHPTLSAVSLKATLMNTVNTLPAWSSRVLSGGRINVANAIAQPSVCSFGISSTESNFPKEGGNGTFNITGGTNCSSAAFSNQPWVVVTSNPNNGNGSVNYTVLPNDTLASRTATLNVGGQTHTITQSAFAPTSATVSISGRVATSGGRAISRAIVTMTDAQGNMRQAITNPFGYYRFKDVAAGQTIIVSVSAKRYRFAPQVVSLTEGLTELNFFAEP